MSGIYTFSDTSESLDSAAVLVEENIVWDHSSPPEDQVVIGYTSTSNGILTDTINESFVSAVDDEGTTQYFSVLETSSDTILGDMTMAMDSSKDIVEETVEYHDTETVETGEVTDVNTNDVMLYNVPGDGLYGIQIAEDEHGNLQKYQFKLRQNEEGQLEAVTESIQILPVDGDEQPAEELQDVPPEIAEPVDDTALVKSPEHSTLFVKQEYNMHNEENTLPDEDSADGLQINDEDTALSFEEEHSEIESKAGILESNFVAVQKHEIIEESHDEVPSEELFTELPGEELDVPNGVEVGFLTEHVVEDENNMQDHEQGDVVRDEHYENVFVQESHLQGNGELEESEVLPLQLHEENTVQSNGSSHLTNENDSDTEDYDVVEGVHVTGDSDIQTLESVLYEGLGKSIPLKPQLVQKPRNYANTRLIRNAVRNNFIKGICDTNGINKSNLFVVRQNEKENVSDPQLLCKYQKPNPRSILKSSFSLLEENKDVNKTVREEQRPVDKRILKNKLTTQARMLQNYIAKTTIIHAPVRQERLPRKQTIKPVKRQDEEIIVQEVVVSSDGFIETSEDGVLKSKEPLQPTAYLNVSDSDDDYHPKKRSRRRRKHKRTRTKLPITITDSDENVSEASVIEVSDSTDTENTKDEDLAKNKSTSSKSGSENSNSPDGDGVVRKRRGRPPKANRTVEEPKKETEEKVPVDTGKQEIKCSKCSKSFPSQGSLKTHMQYHNFRESSLRNAKTAVDKKFSCKQCQAVFKNSTLLNKHLNDHRNLGCTICKKIFPTAVELLAHRRGHVKEKMCRSTVAEKDSPKLPSALRRSVLKSPPKTFKCDFCGRIFRLAVNLDAHVKTHKKFDCLNCGASFISKVMLDVHVRESCVKIRSPTKGRVSLNVRRTLLTSPKKVQQKILNETAGSARKTIFENVSCEQCGQTFTSYTTLFKHRVAKHGVETPDKSVLKRNMKQQLYKPRKEHAGLPPISRLKSAYASLRKKRNEES